MAGRADCMRYDGGSMGVQRRADGGTTSEHASRLNFLATVITGSSASPLFCTEPSLGTGAPATSCPGASISLESVDQDDQDSVVVALLVPRA